MNAISAPRDDQGLIEHHAQRARAGLIPKTARVRQYPAPDGSGRYAPPRPLSTSPRRDQALRIAGWRGPERRQRRVPVLLDTRARSVRSIDLLA